MFKKAAEVPTCYKTMHVYKTPVEFCPPLEKNMSTNVIFIFLWIKTRGKQIEIGFNSNFIKKDWEIQSLS